MSMRLERKLQVIGLTCLLISLSIGSIFASRTITTSSDTLYTQIYNSKGNYWTATGANLQLAIYDLANKSGTVWIPSGITTFTSSSGAPTRALNLGSNLVLQGAGMNSTILKLGSAVDADYLIRGTSFHNITIKDLSIDCNAWGGITDNDIALSLNSCKYLNIINVHIFNVSSSGIGLDSCSIGKITNVYVDDVDDYDNGGYGVGHTGQAIAGSLNTYLQFNNIHIRSNGTNATTYYTWGMDINGWSWCSFNNLYISGTGGGFKLISTSGNTHNLTFSDVIIRNLTNNGSVASYQMQGMAVPLTGHTAYDCVFNNIRIESCWRGIDVGANGKRMLFNNVQIKKNSRICAAGGTDMIYASGDFLEFNNIYLSSMLSAATTAGSGMYLYGCDDSKFSNIEIYGLYHGIYLENGDRDKFTNVQSESNNQYGLCIKTSNNNTFIGCEFSRNTIDGIDDISTTCKNNIFDACIVEGNVKGFDLDTAFTNVTITNCIIKYNTNDGIEIGSTNFVTIMGNQIWGNNVQMDDDIPTGATNISIMGNLGGVTCNSFTLPISAPTVPHTGSMYVNVTTGDIAVYSGSAWIWTHG